MQTNFSRRGPVTKLSQLSHECSSANSPATQALFNITTPTAPDFIKLRKIHYSISSCISKSTSKLICDLLFLYQSQENSTKVSWFSLQLRVKNSTHSKNSIDNYVETRFWNKKLNTLTTNGNNNVFIAKKIQKKLH